MQARYDRQENEACLRVVFPYLHGRRLVIKGPAQTMLTRNRKQSPSKRTFVFKPGTSTVALTSFYFPAPSAPSTLASQAS